MGIKDKIVLITGAANSIGYSTAQDLLRNGAAHIAILDLPNSGGEKSAANLNSEFGENKVIFLPVDVMKSKEFEDGFKKTYETFKGLDIVINNAGISDDSNWEKMNDININGVIRGILLGYDYLSKEKGHNGGTIVNIASIVGLDPIVTAPCYSASKCAVIGLSRSFGDSYYYEKTGVRILTMCPGVTTTPLISEAAKKLLSWVPSEDALKELKTLPVQKVDNVSQGMVHILKNAKNGTIWVSEGGEPVYEVRIPERHTLKVSRDDTKDQNMQIKDKKAIITGGVNTLGLAFARELLRNGAAMVILIDDQESIGRVAAETLNSEFGKNRVLYLSCDVTNSSQFDKIFKEATTALGGLDILINNAETINEVTFNKAIDVNVTAVFRATLLGIQQMGKDLGGKGGVIVNVASILGLDGFPLLPAYATAKHAVLSFSRSFAHTYHYQRSGVRVVVLCPGLTAGSSIENLNAENIEDSEGFVKAIENFSPQRVESVAHGLVYMIRCAQNGSVWVSENSKPVYEIQLPNTLPRKCVQVEDI
ncbi:uncharacterized protein LOC107264179 [Cephus cinctus]|uniref:Uncharacterized protein LOC107264179 n=1 Tax=Cephus cinctus TaxID=211228 RepID=A0AAJ7RAS5_CEPCN|nr:uncharacterized protein LOC107264179 [Cephus cinctus]